MSNRSNRKLTDINHVKGLAKKMSYELKTNIDIIKVSKMGIGTCFDIIETRKNKGAKVETITYRAKIDNLRNNTSEDVLQYSRNKPIRKAPKKAIQKVKSTKNASDGKSLVHDTGKVLPKDKPEAHTVFTGNTTKG